MGKNPCKLSNSGVLDLDDPAAFVIAVARGAPGWVGQGQHVVEGIQLPFHLAAQCIGLAGEALLRVEAEAFGTAQVVGDDGLAFAIRQVPRLAGIGPGADDLAARAGVVVVIMRDDAAAQQLFIHKKFF
jgi:hypothetical protein